MSVTYGDKKGVRCYAKMQCDKKQSSLGIKFNQVEELGLCQKALQKVIAYDQTH